MLSEIVKKNIRIQNLAKFKQENKIRSTFQNQNQNEQQNSKQKRKIQLFWLFRSFSFPH